MASNPGESAEAGLGLLVVMVCGALLAPLFILAFHAPFPLGFCLAIGIGFIAAALVIRAWRRRRLR